jgi:hypothetical protein
MEGEGVQEVCDEYMRLAPRSGPASSPARPRRSRTERSSTCWDTTDAQLRHPPLRARNLFRPHRLGHLDAADQRRPGQRHPRHRARRPRPGRGKPCSPGCRRT